MIARKMELDTGTHATLWKDTVLLEVNKAVLYSYQKCGVTTWDHHTASESFVQFYANEMKTRGGCPADWIWLVPPMSSSSSPLFHQEMAFYFLRPSFEYQVHFVFFFNFWVFLLKVTLHHHTFFYPDGCLVKFPGEIISQK